MIPTFKKFCFTNSSHGTEDHDHLTNHDFNFFLFPRFKFPLRGHRLFPSIWFLKSFLLTIKEFHKNWKECFVDWKKYWHKCIAIKRDFLEYDSIIFVTLIDTLSFSPPFRVLFDNNSICSWSKYARRFSDSYTFIYELVNCCLRSDFFFNYPELLCPEKYFKNPT